MCAAGRGRCAYVMRCQIKIEKLLRLTIEQYRKGDTRQSQGPDVLQNHIVPCAASRPDGRMRERIALHELAQRDHATFFEEMLAIIEQQYRRLSSVRSTEEAVASPFIRHVHIRSRRFA